MTKVARELESKFVGATDAELEREAVDELRAAVEDNSGLNYAVYFYGDEKGTEITSEEAFKRLRPVDPSAPVIVEFRILRDSFFESPDLIHTFRHRFIDDIALSGLLGE